MCDNICLINKGREVLSGSLRDVKKRYGTNSLRIEFDGDGEFLRSLPNVKRADVYQNYAELELHDPAKSGDILSKLDDKLSIRKFEVVEPSLNSIFINVVGVPPAPREVALPQQAPKHIPKAPMDAKVKKELRSVVMSLLALLIISMATIFGKDPLWYLPVAFLAFVGYSFYKYLKVKREVEAEQRQKVGGTVG